MKYLVIAEKPSVSKSIAKVIGAYRQEDGYLEGGDCVVSWCLGHLAEYAAPEHYDERYENWHFEDLPILPAEWKLLVHSTKKPQFNVLRKLLRSKKFDYVVNACDAGREGEAIFRRVYALAGSKLPIKRLWISSMEDAAIQQGFENLRDGAAADVSCVIDNSKVTDHHAILPTMQGAKCDKEKLSETKQKILSLIIWKLVQVVLPPFIYEDVLVTVCCQGQNFTAKHKNVLQPGYTAKPVPLVEPEKNKDASLPNDLKQGMVIPVVRAEKKQGFTSPPKVYTEDTLLSAMETAGNKEFEKDTEKKGLGTPATRAAILEKLVSSGYVQRKGKQMIPTEDGVAAIRNIPDYLKSASMTAEWENDLLRMERGEIKPHDFMQGIHGLIDKMLADLRQIPTVAAAPHHNKVSVGSCPVCGNPVHESKLSFCCADRSCKFALWKESRYLANMRKTLDKKMAVDLLKKGRTHVKDFYSVKKDKTFAADLVMRVEDGRAQYSLEFPKAPMKKKT